MTYLSPSAAQLFLISSACVSFLEETVGHMKPYFSPSDAVLPRPFKEFPSIRGPSVLTIINSSVVSIVLPESFKRVVAQSLITESLSQFSPTSGLSLS